MKDTITVAVQCALAKETKPFLERIENVSHERHGGIDVGMGMYRGARLVVAEGGMGSVSAGAASQMLIDRYEPDCLIFSGIAGGIEPRFAYWGYCGWKSIALFGNEYPDYCGMRALEGILRV